MALDALFLFCEHMNQIVGTDVNKLFGLNGVSLKKSEVSVNSTKGISCNSDSFTNYTVAWPIGKIILDNMLHVRNCIYKIVNLEGVPRFLIYTIGKFFSRQ